MTTALWRRLDTPGHDAAWLSKAPDGWLLEGAAVFRHEAGAPARVEYRVRCDEGWTTREGEVRAVIGEARHELKIERSSSGAWSLNGNPVPGVEDCYDLDFGFTPATNLLQLRRVALRPGEAADFDVAWIDVPATGLVRLPQRYTRKSESTYWYESPTADYNGMLVMAQSGFARVYPGLWQLEE
jgi:hypothetical protein